MVDEPVLRLPLALCRDVSLLGGSALALKVALLLLAVVPEPPVPVDDEELRYLEPVDDVMVRVPMADVVAATGAAPGNVRRAFGVIEGMTASWLDDRGVRVTAPLFEGVGSGLKALPGQAAVYATVAPALTARLGTAREVEVPVPSLRALRTRCGVLMLLRGLAVLHEREGTDTVRKVVEEADLGHYTGIATTATNTAWDQMRAYLVMGAAELRGTDAPVVVRLMACGVTVYDPRPRPSRPYDPDAMPKAASRRQRQCSMGVAVMLWDHRREQRPRRPLPRVWSVEADAPV